ncbi:uncharacterized protein LOC129310289 [Prosopis cineraria]|uniref:uncharacterized protein LOC129310289 n=1 Tax=Prosopis cineraria TaxID=364024 RepID=UPI0024105EC5|nr:uncharacterized protein LOC129310289 [Prosopis cineraria]
MIEALLKAQEMQQETMHISANKEDSYTVDRPAKEHLEDGIKYELLANSPNRHTVAIGRVYSGDIAPNKPLPADHVWVYIEKAIDASYKLPVPIKNKETVGESKGKSLSKQFGHSSKIVASTVMPTHKPQLSNKYQTALDVYAKMYRSNPPVMNIQFDQGIYGTERVDMLSLELVDEVLNHEMTSIPVLSCYIRYLYDKFIIPRGLQTKFLFVSPHDVGAHANIKKEDFENQVKYLSDNFLSRADKETLFLVPYSQGDHWILIVIEPAAANSKGILSRFSWWETRNAKDVIGIN